MLALLLLLQTSPPDIVVTGKRLLEAQAACRRGGCTPLRDAQVSIALAETQFLKGEYLDARRTLAEAVARNRDHAAAAPRAVAALYEAYATVALHEGDQRIYRQAVAGQVRTLRDNLPADDAGVSVATVALGDMWIKLRDHRRAGSAYRAAERAAIDAGQDGAAMLAAIKRVALALAIGQPASARRMLDAIEARPAARKPEMGSILQVMRVRIAARSADDAEMTRLAGEIGRKQGAAPALISAPPFPTDAVTAADDGSRKFSQLNAVQSRSTDLGGVQWIDVGFWIRPDGRTAEAEILRGSRVAAWTGSVLAQIEGRQYTGSATGAAPGAAAAAGGVYRVERITRRSRYMTPQGSLIRRRVNAGGYEILDLTEAKNAPS